MGHFLSLEHLEAIVGLLTGLISILLCLKESGGLRRGKERGEWLVGGVVRTHNSYPLSLPFYMGIVCDAPK